jgi:Galactose oxidase, central domain
MRESVAISSETLSRPPAEACGSVAACRPLALTLLTLAAAFVLAACQSGAGTATVAPTPQASLTVTPSSSPWASPSAVSTIVPSPSPQHGVFTLTGSMREPRVQHAAAMLRDGRVLVVGSGATAEIYDPSTGKFSTTGSLSHDRTEPSAVTLLDGRVLVVGAADNVDAKDTGAEIYDPATGKFTPVRPLIDRSGAAVALLQDGRVLIAGGSDVRSGKCLVSAELYDPASGKFSLTGSMRAERVVATATPLTDGRVLIAGGSKCGGDPQAGTAISFATAEIYDPASGSFNPAGNMTVPREDHAATALSDGRVLITGGFSYQGGSYLSSAEVFNPSTDAFTATGSMLTSRGDHVAVLLPDGKVLVAGGLSEVDPVDGLATAELFDPTTGVFTATGSMQSPRQAFTGTLLPDGEVLVTGGGGDFTSCELYWP